MSSWGTFDAKLSQHFSVDKLEHLSSSDLAEELSGQYQGDIVISPAQMRAYKRGSFAKNGLIEKDYLWTEGVVPYQIITSSFSN